MCRPCSAMLPAPFLNRRSVLIVCVLSSACIFSATTEPGEPQEEDYPIYRFGGSMRDAQEKEWGFKQEFIPVQQLVNEGALPPDLDIDVKEDRNTGPASRAGPTATASNNPTTAAEDHHDPQDGDESPWRKMLARGPVGMALVLVLLVFIISLVGLLTVVCRCSLGE